MCALLFEGMATILATRLRLFGQPSAGAILFEGLCPAFGAILLGLFIGWILVPERKPPPCLWAFFGIIGGFVGIFVGACIANGIDLGAGRTRITVLAVGAFLGAAIGTVLSRIWPSNKESEEP